MGGRARALEGQPDTNDKEQLMAALTEETVLAGVREELTQLKVPGAE